MSLDLYSMPKLASQLHSLRPSQLGRLGLRLRSLSLARNVSYKARHNDEAKPDHDLVFPVHRHYNLHGSHTTKKNSTPSWRIFSYSTFSSSSFIDEDFIFWFRSVQLSSVQFSSAQLSSVQFSSVQFSFFHIQFSHKVEI